MKENLVGRKLFKLAIIFSMLAAIMLAGAVSANAATLKTIPSTSLSVSTSNKLYFGYHNYTAKWTGVSGKVIKGKYNYDLLCVPIKTKTGSFTYTDFLDLTFTNVGNINGRQIDARVHFNSIVVGKRNASGERSDNYFAVCYLADESMWMSSTVTGIGAGYKAPKTIDATTTLYWHDSGQTVNLPFFQCLSDIDAGSSYFKEAWEAKSGFSGIFYKYSTCVLSFSGNKATTPEASDYGGADSLLKAGFYAPTTGGVFRGVFSEGNCATQFIPYSQYTIMSNPVKTSDGKDINLEGDKITYTITQRIGKFYVDTMSVYRSYVMTDVIPQGVAYKSARVYNGAGADITGQGTLKYDAAARKVTFTMGSAWLNNTDNYSGQSLKLVIETVVDKPTEAMKTISNEAATVIDNEVTLTSNKVENVIAVPYHVDYIYVSGTEGRELPKVISTTTGDYRVSDSGTYYTGDTAVRKAAPADGAFYEVYDGEDNYVGRWTLFWDASKKTVESSDVTFTGTWVYTPAPSLIITKKIIYDDEQLTAAHGEPTFLFKVTGKDSGKAWYKSITFSDAVVKESKSKGHYTGADGEQFNLNDGYIYGTCAAIRIPEDDYIVEEIRTVRFDEVSCATQYHNEDGAKSIGTSKTSITVPLKLSTYKAGSAGFGADYASVCFENEKTRWDKLTHTDIVINELEVKQ